MKSSILRGYWDETVRGLVDSGNNANRLLDFAQQINSDTRLLLQFAFRGPSIRLGLACGCCEFRS